MQILLQWKQKVQTNMQKLPVLEMQLFIQFNKNQIYYVIHGKLEYIFMNFQTSVKTGSQLRVEDKFSHLTLIPVLYVRLL